MTIEPEIRTFTVSSASGFGSPQPTEDPEIKRLRRKNALWQVYSPRWNFFMEAYEGGEDFTTRENLFRHTRENEQDYESRAQRVHNMNYCEPLVDFFTNFIFSESIEREGGANKEWYQEFVRDVNRKGETIDGFMRQVCEDFQVFGMSYVLVDAPPLPETEDATVVLSKQDFIDSGYRPYWVLIKPSEMVDWTIDEFEKIQYIKRLQVSDGYDSEGKEVKIEKYTEFLPELTAVTEVFVSEGKSTKGPTNYYPNKLGYIPIYIARFKRSKKYPFLGVSFLRDFAYDQREIMNLTSLLQEFLYRQAFNILVRQIDSNIPLKEQEDGAIGTSNTMDYPKDAQAPAYISPPSTPAQFIQSERSIIKNEMYTRASQDALSELFNGEKSSGFAQAQSFYKTVPFISSRADALELVETQLMECTMEFLGKEWDGKIKYKDRYELTNLTDALTQLQILLRDFMLPSETFAKEELKRMVRQYDGKLPVETMQKIEDEIDKMNFKEWLNTQSQALIGKDGNSPGAQQKPKDTMTIHEVSQESGKTSERATVALKA